MRKLLLLLAVLMLSAVGTAQATTTAPPNDVQPAPEHVLTWFRDKAPATVRSHGSEAFPKADTDEVAAMSVGAPQKTAVLGRGISPNKAIQTSERWIAPIYSADDPVGAISVNFDAEVAKDEIVRGDGRLSAAIARAEKGVVFLWDSQLSAWFALRESTVEPADTAGAKIILGAVPTVDFLAQRERLLTSSTPVPAAPKDVPAVTVNEGRNLPVTLALILLAIGVLVGSLVWLRSERDESDPEPALPETAPAIRRKGIVGARESKMRFRDSGTKVSVYKSPKKKDKNSSGLSDD
ncbi:hypothetical protein [Trueperella pecoris]|uniref:Uncharacterized protein n=1 Tax=Trueperella pecoris TaxID=2733571 RepID=A0A7M1QVA9_9ACTO|nr:hypothetical protein [Trueperella pecoris]QOR45097.1 hypothetical protein INS88_07355 [Trueperella pecoris]QTG75005.1 hypothetical protein J4179_07170 [Trueperella pecoris]